VQILLSTDEPKVQDRMRGQVTIYNSRPTESQGQGPLYLSWTSSSVRGKLDHYGQQRRVLALQCIVEKARASLKVAMLEGRCVLMYGDFNSDILPGNKPIDELISDCGLHARTFSHSKPGKHNFMVLAVLVDHTETSR
jgi:hypothetical protein